MGLNVGENPDEISIGSLAARPPPGPPDAHGEPLTMESPTLERILKSPRLPSLPAVAVQIIDLVQQPDIGLNELAAAVGRDPAMAGKILKTANSSFYAQARTISRVSDALMVLG